MATKGKIQPKKVGKAKSMTTSKVKEVSGAQESGVKKKRMTPVKSISKAK